MVTDSFTIKLDIHIVYYVNEVSFHLEFDQTI